MLPLAGPFLTEDSRARTATPPNSAPLNLPLAPLPHLVLGRLLCRCVTIPNVLVSLLVPSVIPRGGVACEKAVGAAREAGLTSRYVSVLLRQD